MADYRDVEHGCSTIGCDGSGEGKVGKCVNCIQRLVAQGWKFEKSGAMVNKDTGTRVSTSGQVTVSAMYNPRMAALMAGEIEPEDLDSEELAKGMCRNPDGTWPKKRANHVPKVMYDRMTRELFDRADTTLKESLDEAAKSLAKIASDPEVDAGTRLKAATWLYERLLGKAPTEVKVTAEKPFEHVLTLVQRGPRPPVAPSADVG